MVKVTLDLTDLEIQMLINCIESVIDTGHIPDESMESVKRIHRELSKYL